MKFDRNTVLGFVILAGLFFGYFFFANKDEIALRKEQARKDSIANANKPKPDPAVALRDSLAADSMRRTAASGIFSDTSHASEQVIYAENNLFRIAFSTKGGQPKFVELKNFKNMDSGHVKLASAPFNQIGYRVNTGSNSIETAELNFAKIDSVKNADGSTTYAFTRAASDSGNAASIVHKYTIRPDQYMIDFDVELNGAAQLLSQNTMNLTWKYAADQQESDIKFEKTNTQIGYIEDGEFDYHTIARTSSVDFDKKVKWIGVRQRFFNTFLIAKSDFNSGKMTWNLPPDNKHTLVEAVSTMQLTVPAGNNAKMGFSLFYGPADFKTVKKADLKLEKLINLGQGPYAFVRPLNRYVILPVWDFLKSFVGSYGLVIALLTLIIRLLISPLSYKSYLSGAKMKALRPEIAAMKEKFKDDQQAQSMEQMKLFREAGVNPLGGCIPALLQIPIFFSLYSFFSSSVDLRGADFLWAKDLSAFDSVIHWSGNIPVISWALGNHLSLFTITAVATSLAISLYSMSMSPDQSNPVMKYMPYIFPVFLLFIFNQLPSALTWYYTVSNVITLILQFVIQNYIIDHNKILAQIAENRKKPKTKSKWQERMEQMQEQQKQMKEAQKKNKK